MNCINILTKMTKEEIIKHLHKALNSVDITFPYRYVLVEAIEALSQFSFSLDINNAAEEYSLDVKAKPYENLVKEAFKDGATWRDSQIPELPSNLNEAAKEWAKSVYGNPGKSAVSISGAYGFKAGAEWQKDKDIRDMYMSDNRHFQKVYELGRKDEREQIMKKAVKANVMVTKCGDKYQQLLLTDWNSFNDLFNGDKVRIIIVKEEETNER